MDRNVTNSVTALILLSIQSYRTVPIKFANGTLLEYSGRVRSKSGAKNLDLQGFLAKRIAGRVQGSADKTANNLEYQFKRGWVSVALLQAVPISKDEALAVIGYPVGDKGDGYEAHDLVSISVRDEPKIKMIRTIAIPIDGPSSTQKPRLFWKNRKLLLRFAHGFEVIDTDGKKVGFIPTTWKGQFFGINSQNRLVFVRAYNTISIDFYSVDSGRVQSRPIKVPEGLVMDASSYFEAGKVNIHGTLTQRKLERGKPYPKQASFTCDVDANSGKILKYHKDPWH